MSMSDRWVDHDRLIAIFQSSLQRVAEKLQSEGEGPLRYVVKDFKVELSTDVLIDEGTERPIVRLVGLEELVKKKATDTDLSRIGFSLQPAPFAEGDAVDSPQKPPPDGVPLVDAFSDLKDQMGHQDARVRLAAFRRAEEVGAGLEMILPILRKAVRDPDRNIRQAAEAALKSIEVALK